jgi:hypothetical protein
MRSSNMLMPSGFIWAGLQPAGIPAAIGSRHHPAARARQTGKLFMEAGEIWGRMD